MLFQVFALFSLANEFYTNACGNCMLSMLNKK